MLYSDPDNSSSRPVSDAEKAQGPTTSDQHEPVIKPDKCPTQDQAPTPAASTNSQISESRQSVPIPDLKLRFAESIFDSKSPAEAFEKLTSCLPEPEFLKGLKFPNRSLELGAKLESLENLDSEARVDFVRSVCASILAANRFSARMKGEMHKVLLFLDRDEKTRVARELLAKANDDSTKTTATNLLGFVLHSSRDSRELSYIVNRLGTFNLLDLKDVTLRECAALVNISRKLRNLGNPKALNKYSTARPTNEKLNEIREHMLARIELVREDRRFSRTQVARRYILAAEHNLELLAEARSRLKPVKDRREFANMLIEKNKLETRYNLALTCESQGYGHFTTSWRPRDIQDIKVLFSKYSEGLILFTSRFGQIRLVESLGDSVWGQRDGTGLVKISAEAIDNNYISSLYQNVSSLKSVLCHEIWHSIKFGKNGDNVKNSSHIDEIARKTDPRAQFGDFLSLSDWQIIDPARYNLSRGKHSVVIDKDIIADLDRSVELDGQRRELQYDEQHKILYSYRTDSQFSEDPYCRTSPWEDFAEAGTEYLLQHRRLLRRAPWKFLHFEQITRSNRNNKKILDSLQQQLAKSGEKTASSPGL